MVGLFSNIFDPRSGAASAVIKQTSSRVILWPTIAASGRSPKKPRCALPAISAARPQFGSAFGRP